MNDQNIVEFLNGQWPPSVITLHGVATNFELDKKQLFMDFKSREDFCHSENVVQGGYITGMLDAVMAYAAIGMPDMCQMVATLEIKVSFMQIGRDGDFNGVGRVLHSGRSIAFLGGELYQQDKLVASATSTVKLLK